MEEEGASPVTADRRAGKKRKAALRMVESLKLDIAVAVVAVAVYLIMLGIGILGKKMTGNMDARVKDDFPIIEEKNLKRIFPPN